MTVRFLLVCEGSSDAALIPHIRRLLVESGQHDPQGNAWPGSRPLDEKIREGLQYYGDCDLLLVHRDSDSEVDTPSAGPDKRRQEIPSAVSNSGFRGPWVGIVPVQTTEAWLLADEPEIRYVAGRPNSSAHLNLPPLSQVEHDSDPKGTLRHALVVASGTTGRRRKRFLESIPSLQHQLLQGLPISGPLEQVPSWVRFRNDLLDAMALLSGP